MAHTLYEDSSHRQTGRTTEMLKIVIDRAANHRSDYISIIVGTDEQHCFQLRRTFERLLGESGVTLGVAEQHRKVAFVGLHESKRLAAFSAALVFIDHAAQEELMRRWVSRRG